MNTATLRFYSRLNLFLPPDKKQKEIFFNFSSKVSIKDVIESLGPPHTEVSLILVNQTPVDYQYCLRDKDFISVYPRFYDFDISSVSKVKAPDWAGEKFLADIHLKKLAKWMRMLGFDTQVAPPGDDRQVIRIAKAENRMLLTRDMELLKQKETGPSYYIEKVFPLDQLKEVAIRFELITKATPFSRCLECNYSLKVVPKAEVLESLPEKVREGEGPFNLCPGCKRVYWKGTHYQKMEGILKAVQEGKECAID